MHLIGVMLGNLICGLMAVFLALVSAWVFYLVFLSVGVTLVGEESPSLPVLLVAAVPALIFFVAVVPSLFLIFHDQDDYKARC